MMTDLPRLEPSIPQKQLYPDHAAFMARTDHTQTRLLGYTSFNLDAVTTLLIGLLGHRSTIRHRSGVTDEILAVLERTGLTSMEDMRIYETTEQAEQHADQLIEEGKKLFWPYPLPTDRYPVSAHLVPPDIMRQLNAKQNLEQLVPAQNLVHRQIHSIEHLHENGFKKPVYLKAGGDLATGWGYAVRHCPNRKSWRQAVQWFHTLKGVDQVIIEDEIAVQTCWCVTLVIDERQTVFAGAAEQAFSLPGKQSGSIIDPQHVIPDDGVQLAIKVGEAARQRSFVGIAGLDIGLTKDNRLIVFDPNFRINSSSTQVLLHHTAAARCGLNTSYSFHATTGLTLASLAQKLHGPIDDGWFVPTRLIDEKYLPAAKGQCLCSGFILGTNRRDAIARHTRLKQIINS